MALPDEGWNRYCPITIQGTEVSGSPSDFVAKLWWDGVVLNSNLPQEMFDADGSYPCQANGGDIRVTSDEAGENLLPIHIRYITTDNNPANADCEIALGIDTTGSNQTVYVWYNAGGSKTQPGEAATGGINDVYSSCLYANELDVSSGTGIIYDDRSGNGTDAEENGGLPDQRTGTVSTYRQDLDGAGDFIDFNTNRLSTTAEDIVVFSMWVEPDDADIYIPIFSSAGDTNNGDFNLFIDNEFDELGITVVGNDDGEGGDEHVETGTFADGVEYHIALRYNVDTGQSELYRNGVSLGTLTWDAMYALRLQEICDIGQDLFSDEANALFDEVMIMIDYNKGDNYWATYYSSWDDPYNFISVGTPQSPAVSTKHPWFFRTGINSQ